MSRLPGAVERQVYAMRVAALAGVKEELVLEEAERRRKRLIYKTRRAADREQTRPEKQSQPVEKSFRYDNPASAVAEEGVIRLLYLEPELIDMAIDEESFSSDVLRHIYAQILAMLRAGERVNTTTLSGVLSGEEMSLVVNIIQKPERLSSARQSMRDYTERIKNEAQKNNSGFDYAAIARQKQSTAYDSARKRKGYEG